MYNGYMGRWSTRIECTMAADENCQTRKEGTTATEEMVKLGQKVQYIATGEHCQTRTEGKIASGEMVTLGQKVQ